MGKENLRSGWREKKKKYEMEKKQWLQVVWEHQRSEWSLYRGGVSQRGWSIAVERRRRNKECSECLCIPHGEQQQILTRCFSYYRIMSLRFRSKTLLFCVVNKLILAADTAVQCSKMKQAGKCQRWQCQGSAGDAGAVLLCLYSWYLTRLESGNEKTFT